MAAQFIALDLLETPYYLAMIGAATLMFASRRVNGSEGVEVETEFAEVPAWPSE